MRYQRPILLLIQILMIALFGFSEAAAQSTSYTLAQIVAKSKESSSYKKLAEKQIAAKSAVDAKELFWLPKISLNGDAGLDKKIRDNSSDKLSSDLGLSIKAEQPLPANSALQLSLNRSNSYNDSTSSASTTFQLGYNLKLFYKMNLFNDFTQAKRAERRQRLLLEQAELEYQYALISRFYTLFQAQSILKLEQIGFTLSEKNYNEAANKYKAGIIPEVEILEIELFLKRKELSLKQAVDRFAEQKAEFMTFCGLADTAFVLQHTTGSQQEVLIDAVKDETGFLNSSITLLDAIFSLEEAGRQIGDVYQQKSVSGDVNVGVNSFNYSRTNSFALPDENKSFYGRLSLTLPIYQRNEFTNALDYAETAEKIAADNLNDLKKQLSNEFAAKVRELKFNFTNLQLAKKNLELSEKIYRISQNRFNNGLITGKDLIQNQLDYFQSEQSLLNAEIEYILSVNSYKKLTGRQIVNLEELP